MIVATLQCTATLDVGALMAFHVLARFVTYETVLCVRGNGSNGAKRHACEHARNSALTAALRALGKRLVIGVAAAEAA